MPLGEAKHCDTCGQMFWPDPIDDNDTCQACIEAGGRHDAEDGEPPHPEEGDYYTADDASCGVMHFREYGTGKLLLSVRPDERSWVRAVRDHMDRERFWPSVWSLSDHGNWHLLRLSDG